LPVAVQSVGCVSCMNLRHHRHRYPLRVRPPTDEVFESEGAWDVPGVAVPSLGVEVRADDVELAAQTQSVSQRVAWWRLGKVQEAHLREKSAVGCVGREDLVERFAVEGADVSPQCLQMGRFHHDGERRRAPHGLRQPQKGLRAHGCKDTAAVTSMRVPGRASCREKENVPGCRRGRWPTERSCPRRCGRAPPACHSQTGLRILQFRATLESHVCLKEAGGPTHLRGPRR